MQTYKLAVVLHSALLLIPLIKVLCLFCNEQDEDKNCGDNSGGRTIGEPSTDDHCSW